MECFNFNANFSVISLSSQYTMTIGGNYNFLYRKLNTRLRKLEICNNRMYINKKYNQVVYPEITNYKYSAMIKKRETSKYTIKRAYTLSDNN